MDSEVTASDVLKAFVEERALVHIDRRAARTVKVECADGTVRIADSAEVLAKLLERERLDSQVVDGQRPLRKCAACMQSLPYRRGKQPRYCDVCVSRAMSARCDGCGVPFASRNAIYAARQRLAHPRPWHCKSCSKTMLPEDTRIARMAELRAKISTENRRIAGAKARETRSRWDDARRAEVNAKISAAFTDERRAALAKAARRRNDARRRSSRAPIKPDVP